MNTIICRKCGSQVDMSLSECPICGAVYYIVPESDTIEKPNTAEEATKTVDVDEIKKAVPAIAAPIDDETKSIPKAGGTTMKSTPTAKNVSVKNNTRKNLNRPWVFAVIASAIFAIMTVIICLMAGVFDFGEDSTMPNVLGLAQNVAVNELKAHGLSANIVYTAGDEDEGTVIEQSPSAGTEITSKTVVTLTVSLGQAQETPAVDVSIVVPDVMGKSYEQAKQELENLGLTVLVIQTEYSSSVAEDAVTRQSPLSGSNVTAGSTVSLTLSLGEEPKEYRVSLSAGTGGSIDPEGVELLEEGDDLLINITPDEGYEIKELRINGENVGALASYQIRDIEENYSVYALFEKIPEPEEEEPEPDPEPTVSIKPSSSTDIN